MEIEKLNFSSYASSSAGQESEWSAVVSALPSVFASAFISREFVKKNSFLNAFEISCLAPVHHGTPRDSWMGQLIQGSQLINSASFEPDSLGMYGGL